METDMLGYEEAVSVAERLCLEGCTVLGIERFTKLANGYLPDIDGIADYSEFAGTQSQQSIVAARTYFSNFGTSKVEYFVITYEPAAS